MNNSTKTCSNKFTFIFYIKLPKDAVPCIEGVSGIFYIEIEGVSRVCGNYKGGNPAIKIRKEHLYSHCYIKAQLHKYETWKYNDAYNYIPYKIIDSGSEKVYTGKAYFDKSKLHGISEEKSMRCEQYRECTCSKDTTNTIETYNRKDFLLFSDPELKTPLTTLYCADCSSKTLDKNEIDIY